MRLYSTKNPNGFVSLKEAVFKGLPPDNGLFMPEKITPLSDSFLKNLKEHTFQSIAFEVSKHFLQGSIPDSDLKNIITESVNFPAPTVALDDDTHILELFHGPSLAFKDFGARFMAQVMSYFLQKETQRTDLVILVATSGDTGGAVAAGFHNTPGIRVVILYPSGKVSALQEKQLTTLGGNVQALEIDGTFDDCQALVKQAFLDASLQEKYRLSSANSINIARLIPQSFYYFEAFKQIETENPVVFSIPSGNFGNLTAGLFAAKMGLPVHKFIAATNANDVVPRYLSTGLYTQKNSIATLSNAMDVGNPSNFARMLNHFEVTGTESSTWNNMKNLVVGFGITDTETKETMKQVYANHKYVLDPHGAVGYLALKKYQVEHDVTGIILETAHPAKFLPDVENTLNVKINIPKRLAELADKEKIAHVLSPDFSDFKYWLIKNL
jgi:threonine synthase